VGITQGSSDCLTSLTNHILLVLRLRMSGVIPHSPVYLYDMHGSNFTFILVSLMETTETNFLSISFVVMFQIVYLNLFLTLT